MKRKYMKAKLIAGAIGVAAAGLAQAQSNVTLYGVADVGLEFAKSPNGQVTREASGIQSGSRWGMRGIESLGNGINARFFLEGGYNLDNGTLGQGGRLFGRRATVGLQGNFGVIDLGRRDGPMYEVLSQADPHGAGSNLGFNDVLSSGTSPRGYARRYENQLRYETPNYSGFSGQAMYSLGETNTTSGNPKTLNDDVALSAAYAKGPLYLGYVYNRSKDAANLGVGPLSAVTVAVTPHKNNVFAARYDFTVFKLSGAYYTDKRDATALTPAKIDQRIYWIGGSVPFGASTISAEIGKVKDKVSRSTGSADARQLALAYTYTLSKRTNLYAGYHDIRNDNFTTGLGGFTSYSTGLYDTSASSTTASAVRAKSRAWAFGVRHQF